MTEDSYLPVDALGKRLILDDRLKRRFWNKVSKASDCGCWLFSGSRTRDGHGRIHVACVGSSTTNMEYAHRISLLLHGIDVPRGTEVCHSCNVPQCVNPSHLYVGNRRTNCDDVIKSGSQRGENNPMSKLTERDCVAIRWLRSEGFKLEDIGFLFSCTASTVSRISNNKGRVIPA